MCKRTFIRSTTRAIAFALAIGVAGPAGAASHRPPLIGVRGGGTWTTDPTGAPVLTGDGAVTVRNHVEPHAAGVTATVRPDDGSLPAVGECEPATAVIALTGDRDATMTLEGAGGVCLREDQYGSTWWFTGRYTVTHAGRKSFVGTDGWFEVILAEGGSGAVSAYDS
jgi:hypothetical protein